MLWRNLYFDWANLIFAACFILRDRDMHIDFLQSLCLVGVICPLMQEHFLWPLLKHSSLHCSQIRVLGCRGITTETVILFFGKSQEHLTDQLCTGSLHSPTFTFCPSLASHAGVFRGSRISSLPTNAYSTKDNIPFLRLANHAVLSKFWKVDLDRRVTW